MKVRIKAEAVVELNPIDYQSDWENKCDSDGDMEEGDNYPPITDEFIKETFEENLENGNIDLDDIMEGCSIDVMPA